MRPDQKRDDELVPPSITSMMLSWRSLFDMMNPDGDYNVFPFLELLRGVRLSRKARFRYIRAIRKPSLYVYGDRDEFCFGYVPARLRVLSEQPRPGEEIWLRAAANYRFSGRE